MSGFAPLIAAAEPLLVAVVGMLGLVIVGLVALAVVIRRRARAVPSAPTPTTEPIAAAAPPPPRPRARPRVVRASGGGGLAVVATSTAMVCPTCRSDYHGMTYCTRDARRLVPPEEMLGGPLRGLPTGKSAGVICMACRRAYEPGLRACPHDGNELVPFPVYTATRPRRRASTEPTGVIARICPVCSAKYDLSARFCGHDGGELVVIN
jgi:hypothetical protein